MSETPEPSPVSETPEPSPVSGDHRAGYVALIGRPNVGKSTLLNRLLDYKLSIVTAAPQTTRKRVLGILTRPGYQIVFLDTPGILEPRYELQRRMVAQAMSAAADADLIAVLLEARTPLRGREVELLQGTLERAAGRPVVAVLNKIDRVQKPSLLPLLAEITALGPLAETVPVSALKGDGVPLLETLLARHLPVNPPFYPPDVLSDQPERFFAAELVREKVFQHYREEVPYSTAVEITAFEEEPERKKVHIRAEVVVERESQKGILIGKRGRALKQVGQEARADLEQLLGRPVYLELQVRVRHEWRRDVKYLEQLGL
jgi:GTP-binding protein Era